MAETQTHKMDFFTQLAIDEPSGKTNLADPPHPTALADSCTDLIAQKYDVRNISSGELTTMSRELFQSERIDRELFAMLSFQPELSNAYDQVGTQEVARPRPDQFRDAIDEWKKILDKQMEFNNSSFFTGKTRDVIYLLESLDKARRGI